MKNPPRPWQALVGSGIKAKHATLILNQHRPPSNRARSVANLLESAGWTLSCASAADGPAVFLAIRWNMPRELASLDAVAKFADMVGAPA